MEVTDGKKVYLIDSENVGDVWVTHIMEFAKPQDEIVVFYTQKSPYMSYENIRKLMETDREIVFIKCVEGQNALDFQLVTELGYRIGNNHDETEYVVVTNDTGFDAAVRYWKTQGRMVKRYNVKFCQMLLTQFKAENKKKEKDLSEKQVEQETKEVVGETEIEKEELLEPNILVANSEIVKEEENDLKENIEIEEKEEFDKLEELIYNLLSCIGKTNIPDFHNALIIFLGDEKGKEVYQQIKEDISDYMIKKNMKEKEKFKVYCQLVFAQETVEEEYPKNFSNFVYDAKEKRGNLNTFRATLLEKYGKEKGMVYYNIIKPHVKILNRIQKIK
ncbi:MAG: hypothetical protein HFJ09_09125 [Lachnospiraceae bacterium]|nr:hypothetical protein [Lachnospiraceae bacterium]